MQIKVQNNLDAQSFYSYLSNSGTAGGSSHTIQNINGFTSQWAVQFGKTGEERSEILVLSSAPSGSTITTSGTLRFAHPVDTPVYNIHFNKIIFKRSTSGTSGTATAMTDGTINITPDSTETVFTDTTGVNSYAYKTQYYNDVTGDLSSESSWIVPGGPTFYSLQKLRKRIKDGIYNTDYIKDDSVIDDWINEYLEVLNNAAVKVNKDYLLGTATIAFGTAGYGTITSDDFMYARKVEVTYDGANYGTAQKIELNNYDDTTVFAGIIAYSWHGNTVFRILPNGSQGTARIIYSKGDSILTEDSDELAHPFRRYTRGFVYYGRSCAYENDQKDDTSKTNYEKAMEVKADFISEITPRDFTGVTHIDYVEPITADSIGFI